MSTTTNTPVADALAAYETYAEAVREQFEAERREHYRTQPAADVIAAARAAAGRFVRRDKLATKEAAVNYLIRDEWRDTDASKHLADLQRAADREERVPELIEAARTAHDKKRAAIREALDNNHRYELVMDAVADARLAQGRVWLWESVERQTEDGKAPLDAVETVRSYVTDQLLAAYNFRPLSRSTSVTRNLDEDLNRQAMAEWLEETGRWF